MIAERGTDSTDADQFFKQRLFILRQEAVERERIFTHVSVNAEPHFGARIGQVREGGDRNGDVIADTSGFHDGLVRMFLKQNPAQLCNHQYVL